MAQPIKEIVFSRSPVTLQDSSRLQDGNDLNDALLDFFMKLGMDILPVQEKPCVYALSSLFYQKLTGSGAKSGEDGWENVKGWTKRIKPGLLTYPAVAIPINETLTDPDNKKIVMGQHWWLALVLNPAAAATGDGNSVVVCVDSMKRRITPFDPPHKLYRENSLLKYAVELTKLEQAASRLWVYFDAEGDGSQGMLQDPRTSTMIVDKTTVVMNPTLALQINNNVANQPSRYQGTLEYALDGRCKASSFTFCYGANASGGYPNVDLVFDAFSLSKMQKNVTRYTSGFLKKEWEKEGHKETFEKSKVRAVMVNAPQQENLYDCGVFVLENILCILQQGEKYISKVADDPANEDVALWVGQAEVRHRRRRLVDALGIMFGAAGAHGTGDLAALFDKDPELKSKVRECLTDLPIPQEKKARTEG